MYLIVSSNLLVQNSSNTKIAPLVATQNSWSQSGMESIGGAQRAFSSVENASPHSSIHMEAKEPFVLLILSSRAATHDNRGVHPRK
jgi:hypothetical protein